MGDKTHQLCEEVQLWGVRGLEGPEVRILFSFFKVRET